MTDPQVRAELAQADLVLPSLDSLVPEEFAAVNRAHPGLDPKAIADGILAFKTDSQASGTKLFLEVLLVAGVNDSERNLELLADYCNRLQPDRVDVVTLSRPGTRPDARAVDKATLSRWRERLDVSRLAPAAGVALAQSRKNGQEQSGGMQADELRARLLASLARRPQTGAQLAEALLADQSAVLAALRELLEAGRIALRQQDGQDYYQARTKQPTP
jgi:wyosine [tRNA(Phe)-imidazoG37] synthetase (radical SAM superfamily)